MSPRPASESSRSISTALLERVRDNDSQAWRRLVELYGPVIYEWARKSGLEPNCASDIVQETFGSVLTAVGGFRRTAGGDTFRGWLWTITRNKIRDRARRHKVQGQGGGGTSAYLRLAEIPAEDEMSEASVPGTFNVARRAVELVRAEFEERTWQAFWRTSVEDERPDLVAGALGMTLGSVYTAKSRVLRRLREELAGEF